MGQQEQTGIAVPVTVTLVKQSRSVGVSYFNSGSSAAFVFVSLSTATSPTTSYLFIGGTEVAQGQHMLPGQSLMLAGIVNPNELYYVSTTASSAAVLDWAEYVI